jgi:hypothetical protein
MFDGKKQYLGKGVRSDTVKFRFIEDRGYETMIIIPGSIDFKVEYRTLFFDLRKLYEGARRPEAAVLLGRRLCCRGVHGVAQGTRRM